MVQVNLDHWRNVYPGQVRESQASFNPQHPKDPGYFYQGLYAYHLQRWLTHFSREQMLILTLGEMAQSPSETLNRVCHFLGIPEYNLEEYRALNQGRYSKHSDQDHYRAALAEAFTPHDQQLEALLQKPLPWRE